MGCFSFNCKKCNKGVLSNSFVGEKVKLFLLKDGKVIEKMEGEYDSYGRVFMDGTQRSDVKHDLRESLYWQMSDCDIPLDEYWIENYGEEKARQSAVWSAVCNLMSSKNAGDGIAAIHERCWDNKEPTTESSDDPNQGWGESMELLSNIDNNLELNNG